MRMTLLSQMTKWDNVCGPLPTFMKQPCIQSTWKNVNNRFAKVEKKVVTRAKLGAIAADNQNTNPPYSDVERMRCFMNDYIHIA